MRARLAMGAGVGMVMAALASAAQGSGPPVPGPAQIHSEIAAAERTHELWATVNICNTPRHPDMIGIRGQMPALGFRASLQMEITVEYWSSSDGRFEPDPYAQTDVSLGRATSGLHQGGVIFQFSPPELLSGVITYRWKRHGKLIATATRKTGRVYKHVDHADPRGYSRATCNIS